MLLHTEDAHRAAPLWPEGDKSGGLEFMNEPYEAGSVSLQLREKSGGLGRCLQCGDARTVRTSPPRTNKQTHRGPGDSHPTVYKHNNSTGHSRCRLFRLAGCRLAARLPPRRLAASPLTAHDCHLLPALRCLTAHCSLLAAHSSSLTACSPLVFNYFVLFC